MKIGIIGAMEEEVVVLRDKMTDLKKEVIGNCEFNIGELEGVRVVLLRSGIGKVNAAIATTILLEKFQPDYVINTGSAGGFDDNLNIGDVLISTEVRHHDVDATIFNYDYGQVPGLPAAFLADEKLIEIAEKSAQAIADIKTVKGLVATGDSFMSDPRRVEFVKEQFPQLLAAEMEGAAIAQVAYQFKVPFLVIRSLSDIAGKESNISFDKFIETAAINSANLVSEILKNVKEVLS